MQLQEETRTRPQPRQCRYQQQLPVATTTHHRHHHHHHLHRDYCCTLLDRRSLCHRTIPSHLLLCRRRRVLLDRRNVLPCRRSDHPFLLLLILLFHRTILPGIHHTPHHPTLDLRTDHYEYYYHHDHCRCSRADCCRRSGASWPPSHRCHRVLFLSRHGLLRPRDHDRGCCHNRPAFRNHRDSSGYHCRRHHRDRRRRDHPFHRHDDDHYHLSCCRERRDDHCYRRRDHRRRRARHPSSAALPC
mmetsp:Transcript_38715/g.79099  ORF Transcript_38715/g.79099 Transcript_38715/m.79099 type:complete len:244 (-) Transcript_38715:314-1045(-)